jgi:hypothetical protein
MAGRPLGGIQISRQHPQEGAIMVNGSPVIFYSKDADKVRSFFEGVLKLGSVAAGHGWLIFALPSAEFAVHPTEDEPHYELYLMCDDIQETMKDLQAK